MPRQQRTSNSRGRIPPSQVPRQDMLWDIVAVVGTAVTVALTGSTDRMVQNGIPAFHCLETDELASACSIAGNTLLLTMPSPPPQGCTFRLATNDRAISNAYGGILSAGTGVFGFAPFVPVLEISPINLAISAACTIASGGGNVDMTLPAPTQVGEQWVCGAENTLGTTATILSGGGSGVGSATMGQLGVAEWTGSGWSWTLIIS